MSLSPDGIRRLASLARLRLSPEEEARMAGELSGILAHLEVLVRADADAPHPVAAPGRGAPLREDRVAPEPLLLPPGELAPAWEQGLFVVPRLAAMEAPPEEGA